MPSLVKRIRSRFGIAAPKMTVRTHVAWYWRWLGIAVAAAVALTLAAWMYDAGRRFAGFDSGEAREELSRLRAAYAGLEKESAGLRAVANASDARLKIEQTAQARLAAQIKQLGDENNRLKEDLAFFDGLNRNDGRNERLSIHRFVIERGDAAGQYRYRLLMVQGGGTQAGRRDREFQGSMQLLAEPDPQNQTNQPSKGRNDMIPLVEEGATQATKQLNFRFFQRQEGTFRIAPGSPVRRVQVRVFENGGSEPRAVQSAPLP